MNIVILFVKDTYGEWQRADMFKDETISVTSKIKDVKDISKIFTDFSQSFTLPASKKNNKIFANFHRYDIIGDDNNQGVYDPRKKIDAKLEINHIPFREGKVFLNSVGMMDNSAYSYNVTFFGNTVNLKTLFGEDKLQSLSFIDNFSHEWNNTNVREGFVNGLDFTVGATTYLKPIVYPLITSRKRLFYDSGAAGQSHDFSGNLYYHTDHSHTDTGLAYTDLKPAISVRMLLEGIQQKYGIEFTDDFFGSEVFNPNFSWFGLYLWLSREKGQIGEGGDDLEKAIDGITYSSGDPLSSYYRDTSIEDYGDLTDSNFQFVMETTYSGNTYIHREMIFKVDINQISGDKYSLMVIDTNDNNKIIEQYDDLQGDKVISFSTGFRATYDGTRSYQFVVSSTSQFVGSSTLTLTEKVWRIGQKTDYDLISTKTTNFTTNTISPISQIVPTQRVPDLKVYDFLSGIFKMFNLIAYYDENPLSADYGKIKVTTLNDFYANETATYDITKYVDASKSTIEAAVPYSDISFKYEDPKTLLMLQHKESTNEVFGDTTYTPKDVDRGKKYEIKLPFAHMKYERIYDDDTEDVTGIMWGYSAGDNFKPDADADPPIANYEPELTKPLLFYTMKQGSGAEDIAWLTPSYSSIGSYIKPSNSLQNGRDQLNPVHFGNPTSIVAFRLIDSGFLRLANSEVGDVVYNTTTGSSARVVSIISDNELELDVDIFNSVTEDYAVTRAPKKTINFDIEFDEWTRVNYGVDSETLFSEYYSDYIEGVFNPRARMFKVTAHLPSRILLNYRLNDRFVINDKAFVINSIDTNLLTGESKIELLNIL